MLCHAPQREVSCGSMTSDAFGVCRHGLCMQAGEGGLLVYLWFGPVGFAQVLCLSPHASSILKLVVACDSCSQKASTCVAESVPD